MNEFIMMKAIITITKKVLLSPITIKWVTCFTITFEERNGFYWFMKTTQKIDIMSAPKHGARKTRCSMTYEGIKMVERLSLRVKKQPSNQTFYA